MPNLNPTINIKNLNYVRNAKVIDGQGSLHGHLVAACFDDVNQAYGNLATQLAAALERIAALEKK